MKTSRGYVSWLMMALLFLAGFGFHNAVAQQAPAAAAAQSGDKFPPDVHPDTRSRMPKATRDQFTTDADKDAFDKAVAKGPVAYSGWNGIRLHVPIVHTAYRDAIQTLDKETEPRYQHLAMLVGARAVNDESDFVNHDKASVKVLPRDVVEVVRNKKDLKGLEEKDAVLIQFGREMFEQPKVSSKTFANMERLFGRRQTYAITQIMIFFAGSGYLLRAYDVQLDPGDARPFPDVLAAEAKGK